MLTRREQLGTEGFQLKDKGQGRGRSCGKGRGRGRGRANKKKPLEDKDDKGDQEEAGEVETKEAKSRTRANSASMKRPAAAKKRAAPKDEQTEKKTPSPKRSRSSMQPAAKPKAKAKGRAKAKAKAQALATKTDDDDGTNGPVESVEAPSFAKIGTATWASRWVPTDPVQHCKMAAIKQVFEQFVSPKVKSQSTLASPFFKQCSAAFRSQSMEENKSCFDDYVAAAELQVEQFMQLDFVRYSLMVI